MNFAVLPGQLQLALCLCYGGMAAACVYDVLTPLRRGKAAFFLVDFLFGMGAGILYALILAYCGQVQLRLAGLLFFLLGFGLYRLGPGRLIRFCFHHLSGRKKEG